MNITVQAASHADVAELRAAYRAEANCQIIADSLVARGLAQAYLIEADGQVAAYGAVRTRHDAGRLTEYYTVPHQRADAGMLFERLLAVSGATSIEAQTNLPVLLTMLYDFATDIVDERVLFADTRETRLACPGGSLRAVVDGEPIFEHRSEPVGPWCIESGGAVVATGGSLCHYNPPYADLYMEVAPHARRRGYGSYLIQELKRVSYESGHRPAARCNVDNTASRRTLQRAGMAPCGRVLVGRVR